jgi:hypothetical protein
MTPQERGQHSVVLWPRRGDEPREIRALLKGRGGLARPGFLRAAREDRAKVYACGNRPRGDSVVVALERADCASGLEAEHTEGERSETGACEDADDIETLDGAGAADELAGVAIALGDAGHEPLELSPERAGLSRVHQFVDARECRLASSGREVFGGTLNEHLDLLVAGSRQLT